MAKDGRETEKKMKEMRDFLLTFIVKLFTMGALHFRSPKIRAFRDNSKQKEVKRNDEG